MLRYVFQLPENIVYGNADYDNAIGIETLANPLPWSYTALLVGHPGRNPLGRLRAVSQAQNVAEYLQNLARPGVLLGFAQGSDLRDDDRLRAYYGTSYIEIVDAQKGLFAANIDTTAPAFQNLQSGADVLRVRQFDPAPPNPQAQLNRPNLTTQPLKVQQMCGANAFGSVEEELAKIDWRKKPEARTIRETQILDINHQPIERARARHRLGRVLQKGPTGWYVYRTPRGMFRFVHADDVELV